MRSVCTIFAGDMTNRYAKCLKFALLALFTVYVACLTVFTHVHIINGVTVVHSHVYPGSSEGKPMHTHTLTVFHLLHQLSTVQLEGSAWAACLPAVFFIPLSIICCHPVRRSASLAWLAACSLRGPPAWGMRRGKQPVR